MLHASQPPLLQSSVLSSFLDARCTTKLRAKLCDLTALTRLGSDGALKDVMAVLNLPASGALVDLSLLTQQDVNADLFHDDAMLMIGSMTSLICLTLARNSAVSVDSEGLQPLSALTQLHALALGGTFCVNKREHAATALGALQCLNSLRLRLNSAAEVRLADVAPVLNRMTGLQRLRLTGTSDGCTRL